MNDNSGPEERPPPSADEGLHHQATAEDVTGETPAASAAEDNEDGSSSVLEAEEVYGKVLEDDEESLMMEEDQTEIAEDDDEVSVKSHGDAASVASQTTKTKTPKGKTPRKAAAGSSVKKGRTPSVAGLTIPFRTVKKAMKLEPETPIVQNEAAIMTTFAVELFLKRLAKDSLRIAKNRGKNTVRYEDVAEARTSDKALAFLEPLLP